MKTISVKTSLIMFVAAFVISIFLPALVSTAQESKNAGVEQITIVRGFIESVSDDSIVVNSMRYTIAGVSIEKTLGMPAKKDDLQKGKRVTLFFKYKRLVNILISDSDLAP
jgi:hypothetical protein